VTKKPTDGDLERCPHSLRDRTVDVISDEEFYYNRPCVLIFHTAEDAKGRPIHQDDRGRTWS
jgi:hypothetical protein